ncbi:MAG: M28 family metallopeptidase [Promethearchaeota archaeon]
MPNKKTQDQHHFDEERLFNYIKKYSFPRLSGTKGEEKAVEMCAKDFKDLGFEDSQIIKEPFEFSDFYSTSLIKLIMSMSLVFILLVVLSVYIYTILTIALICFMAVIVILIMRGLKHPEDKGFWGEYFGDTHSSTNVIAYLPAKSLPPASAGDIVISAHLDTKSQTFKTAWRIVIYRVWLFSGIIMGGVVISYILWDLKIVIIGRIEMEIFGIPILLIDFISWILAGMIMASNIFLMFLDTYNKSPGALDNASGMAIVFEVSSYFKKRPCEHFNLWFCQFSAEELGTMGSRIFTNNREDQFTKGRVFQINVDMVSAAGLGRRNRVEYLKSYGVFPRKQISPLLSKYLDKAAELEKIKIKGFHLTTGAHLDSVAFHLRGYDALDISTRAAAKWAHDKVDTPDKVDPKILRDTCYIIQRAVEMLDENYEDLRQSKELVCEEE